MGFSGKPQVVDGGIESEGKRWVIAGIPSRAQLTTIFTTPPDKDQTDNAAEEGCKTPTSEESKIPTKLTCPPPPPRKRKPSLKCNYGANREFFTPPDLESVFVRRHVEKAN
ncbi:cyclin-dependent protein kinase inhibitor SMR6-like [Carica papaya]|uniref:cyclin-dependent protein kinase inhibitor SMR6-like n=1 Tax=Carica papaya TaxID=3649 RepID=UPI000B8D086D|nr:cyclin-dependent protein kinase inhibitor SMR6-like [Carica papaya]